MQTTRDAIEPLAQSARISKARAEDYGRLVEGKYVGRHEYLLREQERIAAERELATQRNRMQEIRAAISTAEEEFRVLVADFRQQTLDQLLDAEQQVAQGASEMAKASQRDRLMTLRAPVDGTVQDADSAQLPQSINPVVLLVSMMQSGCACGNRAEGRKRETTFRAPLP